MQPQTPQTLQIAKKEPLYKKSYLTPQLNLVLRVQVDPMQVTHIAKPNVFNLAQLISMLPLSYMPTCIDTQWQIQNFHLGGAYNGQVKRLNNKN